MKSHSLRLFLQFPAPICLSLLLAACANLGVTEPVLGNPGVPTHAPRSETRYGSLSPAESSVVHSVEKYDDSALLRDLAALRADFRVLQEENQKMSLRMENIERELLGKDAQLKELQSLLSVLDGQIASADKQWSERMENLKRNMDAEREQRRQQLDKLSSNVAQELSRVQSKTITVTEPTPGSKYVELVIQKGDTLSGIAASSGVTVQQLIQFNGLKNDRIFVGQVLKVPVK